MGRLQHRAIPIRINIPTMATPKAISCNGQEFGSIKALADHYGFPKARVTRRLAQGWSPEQAVGLLEKKRTGSSGKTVEFEGKRFPSLVAASISLGLDPRLIAARVRNGYSPEDALRGNMKDRSGHAGKVIAFRGCVFQSQEELAKKYSISWRTVWKRQQRGWTLEQALGLEPNPPRFRNFEGHARDHKWKEVRVTSGKVEPVPDTQGYKLYLVTNNINEKVYVGLTIGALENRLKQHFAAARKGRKSAFANAIRKYGEQAFRIELLKSDAGTYNELQEQEILEIQKRNAIKNGYNTALGGSIGTSKEVHILGRKFQSYAGAAEAYGIDPVVFALRVSRLKWTPEQAAELEPRKGQGVAKKLFVAGRAFNSLKAAAIAFGCEYKTVHKRFRVSGWTLEQSLEIEPPPKVVPVDSKGVHLGGIHYASIADAARAHSVSVHALRRFIRLGIDPDEAIARCESHA